MRKHFHGNIIENQFISSIYRAIGRVTRWWPISITALSAIYAPTSSTLEERSVSSIRLNSLLRSRDPSFVVFCYRLITREAEMREAKSIISIQCTVLIHVTLIISSFVSESRWPHLREYYSRTGRLLAVKTR